MIIKNLQTYINIDSVSVNNKEVKYFTNTTFQKKKSDYKKKTVISPTHAIKCQAIFRAIGSCSGGYFLLLPVYVLRPDRHLIR